MLLEQEEDVNQLTEFFSYEHFYVIYCKFWELDTDHDLYIDQKDLGRHNDQGAHTQPASHRNSHKTRARYLQIQVEHKKFSLPSDRESY